MQYHNTKHVGDDVEKRRYPKISLAKVYKIRKKIRSALAPLTGRACVSAEAMVPVYHAVFAGITTANTNGSAHITNAVCRSTDSHCGGLLLSKDLAEYLARRFAGNYSYLRGGGIVERYLGLASSEWAYLNIDSVSHTIRQGKRDMVRMDFSVLSGGAAGEVFSQLVPVSLLGGFAKRLGLISGRKAWESPPVRMFVGCKLLSLLVFKGELQIEKYVERPITTKINRLLLRSRTTARKCPFSYTWSCAYCPRGKSSCPIATQNTDYPQRNCPGCHKYSWYLPLQSPGGLCLICRNKSKGVHRAHHP
jgi:hypothetical protein